MTTESSHLSHRRSPRRPGPNTSSSCGEELSLRTSISTHKHNAKTLHIFLQQLNIQRQMRNVTVYALHYSALSRSVTEDVVFHNISACNTTYSDLNSTHKYATVLTARTI
jgi:hypothetical protein